MNKTKRNFIIAAITTIFGGGIVTGIVLYIRRKRKNVSDINGDCDTDMHC